MAPPGEPVTAEPQSNILIASVKQLRPKQWLKNVFLFPALVFSGGFLDPAAIAHSLTGFAAFCLLSSTGYILNDYLDREADRKHPKKRHRPIASGALPIPAAAVLFVGCLVGGALLALSLSPAFLGLALTYLVTTLSYSFYFKHIVILDVLFLAAGFVWRTVAGAVAIAVHVSPWLFLCTVFVALFFGFHKRGAELRALGSDGGTRKNLAEYNPEMLKQLTSIVTSATIVTYMLYTVRGPTAWMTLTVPLVLYGLFRFIYLVEQKGEGGAPDETVLSDRPLLMTGVLYVVVALMVLFGEHMKWLPHLPE